jgi:hypothetical protein
LVGCAACRNSNLTVVPFADWTDYTKSAEKTAHYYTTDEGTGKRALEDCPNHANPFIWDPSSKKTMKRVPGWIAAALAKGDLKKP